MLNTEKKMENGALYIALEGKLDTLTSPDFNTELQQLLCKVDTLTLDFKKLEYISSAGLRVLLAAALTMEDKNTEQVKILNCNDATLEVFKLTGFADLFVINP